MCVCVCPWLILSFSASHKCLFSELRDNAQQKWPIKGGVYGRFVLNLKNEFRSVYKFLSIYEYYIDLSIIFIIHEINGLSN